MTQRARYLWRPVLVCASVLLLFGCDPESSPSNLVGPQPIKYAQHDVEQGTVDVETGRVVLQQVCYEDCGPLTCLDCRLGLCDPPVVDCADLRHRDRLQKGLE